MSETLTQQNQVKMPEFNATTNPFPGLRPFGIEESHLFFGREGQSEDVLKKLSDNRFVAVIGASGTGKSSLIYCGLVPILYGGFIASAGSQWKIITCRPGSHPIDNLSEAIVKSEIPGGTSDDKEIKKSIYSAILRRSSLGLVETLRHLPNTMGENTLLLIDQFEELFRFRLNQKDTEMLNESSAFVKLLVEAVRQSEVPVYTVITMRSDFIGECSQFQELTWLINKSNYLIPQMTRDDFKDAILGPVAVGNATIEPSLVQQLLNDVGDNTDQLPILQHAMMRTWDYWLNNSSRDKSIGISDYDAIGKMEKALSEHANEAYDELTESGKHICESLFKTITEKGNDNRGVRRPTRLEDIATIAKASVDEVIDVVEKFRVSGRSFLTPPHEVPLSADSIIDLSHESLMRIWNRLKVWVEEESTAVDMYMRLSEAAALYQEGKTGLWRPPDLQLALNWEKKQQPTLTWAQRYNPAFERTMVFLHTSEKEFLAEEQNKIKLQKRTLRRTKIFAGVLGGASVISLGFMIFAQMQRIEAEKQKKIAIEKTNEATQQKTIAEKNFKEATAQKKIADEQTQVAIKQSQIAEQQKEIALINSQEAIRQKDIANQKSQEATQQKLIAENKTKEALEQKTAAEKAREEAYNRRLLSISQSMAVKSLQVDDKDLKALLAYQSNLFNIRYKGLTHNADVYSALYGALGSLNKKGYNIFKGHTEAINSMVFEPNSTILYSAGSDGRIFKWDITDTLKTPVKVADNKFINKAIDISSDGKWLACGTIGLGVELIDLKSKNYIAKLLIDKGRNINTLAFMPDNKTIIAASDSTLFTWNIETGESKVVAKAEGLILSISVSPDGTKVAGGTKNGKTILWNTQRDYAQTILTDDSFNQIYSVCFNKKGDRLATGSLLGYLRIWDVENNKVVSNIRGHSARIVDIKFSPDDMVIATSSYDQTVQLWDATNINTPPIKLKDHESWVLALAFCPNNNFMISGSSKEDRMIMWPTQTKDMASTVYTKLTRNFTQDEWNTYVGADIPYEKTLQNK